MIAMQIYDRRAKTLPNVGLMKIKDSESGQEMYIDTGSKKLRLAHTKYWAEQEQRLGQTFSKSKVDWMSVATDEDYVRAMMNLFASRKG